MKKTMWSQTGHTKNKIKLNYSNERSVQTKNKTTSKTSPIIHICSHQQLNEKANTDKRTPHSHTSDKAKQLNIADVRTKTIASHLMQQYRYWYILMHASPLEFQKRFNKLCSDCQNTVCNDNSNILTQFLIRILPDQIIRVMQSIFILQLCSHAYGVNNCLGSF